MHFERLRPFSSLGLVSLREEEWVSDIPSGPMGTVRVTAVPVPVEHTVKLKDLTQWVERQGRSPRDITHRSRVREILGLPSRW